VYGYWIHVIAFLAGKARTARKERGSLTLEQAVIAALLFLAALGLIAVIVAVVKSKEASITNGGSGVPGSGG
jgi:Flp pilus assembly protein TadG